MMKVVCVLLVCAAVAHASLFTKCKLQLLGFFVASKIIKHLCFFYVLKATTTKSQFPWKWQIATINSAKWNATFHPIWKWHSLQTAKQPFWVRPFMLKSPANGSHGCWAANQRCAIIWQKANAHWHQMLKPPTKWALKSQSSPQSAWKPSFKFASPIKINQQSHAHVSPLKWSLNYAIVNFDF